ncbi:MAG: hypothetical protein ABIB43_02955 [archaeon]
MTFVEIKRIFEKRKFNLIKTLENEREDIELSKQHQIYGAIKELENILKTIDYYQEIEVQNHFEMRLVNEQNQSLIQKIGLKLRNRNTETKRQKINQ